MGGTKNICARKKTLNIGNVSLGVRKELYEKLVVSMMKYEAER